MLVDKKLTLAELKTAVEVHGIEFPDGGSNVVREIGLITKSEAKVTYRNGETVTVEVYNPFDRGYNKLGRPVIYLDQKLWVRLSQTMHSPRKMTPQGDLGACRKIIELARAGKIILPISHGHLIETCGGAERLKLALLMLELSRGWMMRDPSKVRDIELIRIMPANWSINVPREGDDSNSDTFTLEPFAILPSIHDPHKDERRHPSTAIGNSLTWVATLLDEFGEDRHIQRDRAPSDAWAEAANDFMDELVALKVIERDTEVHRVLVSELSDSLEGMTGSVLPRDFLSSKESKSAIAGMPYFSRYYDYMRRRLKNPQHRFEGNDFIDIGYLTCASAYADFVVTEKQAKSFLTSINSQSSTKGAEVFMDLQPLVDRLTELKIT